MRIATRAKGLVNAAVSRLTRALDPFGPNAGFSIVRGQQPSEFQQSGAEVRRLGWERHPVVNACARVVVELIQAVPLEVYRKRADGTANVLHGNNEALTLLSSPRQGLNGSRLVGRSALHLFLYGNAFWVLERRGNSTRGMPRSIRVVPPENIQFVWIDTNDVITAYDWRDLQGHTHSREPIENVIHFRDLDATDGLFGYPRLAAALNDISSDSEASKYVREVVTNHGTPGIIIQAAGAPSLDDLEGARIRWQEKWTTRGNRGGAAFLAGVDAITPIGFNLQQLEFPDLRKVTRESICAAAAVDPRMIGVGTASTDGGLSGVQFREARHRLIQQTVYPIMRAIENELNYWFMPEYGDKLVRFSEDYIAAMTEDVTATSARVVAELAAKMITVEEARESTGRDPDMEPTHHMADGLSVQEAQDNASALGAAAVTQAQTPPTGVSAPDPNQQPLAAGIDTRAQLVRAAVNDSEPDPLEQQFERAALLQFASERAEIDKLFASLHGQRGISIGPASGILRLIVSWYSATGKFAEAWRSRFEELIARAIMKGGRDTAARAGLDFTIANPRVRGLVNRRTDDLVTSVTETTRDAIRSAIITGLQQGMSTEQIAKVITDTTFGAITQARAKTIARTEVVGAKNSGQYAAAVQSGVMRSKTWITNIDGRERESHNELNNTTIPIGSAFPNGLRYPGDPMGTADEVINCRCSLEYSDTESHDI
jgi:HK97 family phage portal protein